jgi:hypothetical protein
MTSSCQGETWQPCGGGFGRRRQAPLSPKPATGTTRETHLTRGDCPDTGVSPQKIASGQSEHDETSVRPQRKACGQIMRDSVSVGPHKKTCGQIKQEGVSVRPQKENSGQVRPQRKADGQIKHEDASSNDASGPGFPVGGRRMARTTDEGINEVGHAQSFPVGGSKDGSGHGKVKEAGGQIKQDSVSIRPQEKAGGQIRRSTTSVRPQKGACGQITSDPDIGKPREEKERTIVEADDGVDWTGGRNGGQTISRTVD